MPAMKKTTKALIGTAVLVCLVVLAVILAVTMTGAAAATMQEPTPSTAEGSASNSSAGEYAEGVIDISLGDTITVSGEGASIDGSTVAISAAGVYHVTGTLGDGQIDVDAKGKVYLEFDGVDITCSFGPALNITDAKKVTLTLAEGTTNSLTDADSACADDAALFTNDTLVINGSGTLVVTGNNNEGISSDDDLIINSGTVKVTAVDDGLNAHDDITINDGAVYILAGGDGIDSNGTVNLNGGALVSFGGAADGDGGLDAVGAFSIKGGTAVLFGNAIANPTDDSRRASLYVATGSIQAAGAVVRVEREGEEILTITAAKEFQNMLLASDALIDGAAYQVYVEDSGLTLQAVAATSPVDAGITAGPDQQ
jgi:hypothetical protein